MVTQDGIREAQGLVGELLWVSVRTRPDVAFEVSWVSQHVTRCPLEVVKAGKDMMAYLHGTKDLGLALRGRADLPFTRSMRRLDMYADISFAPQGEKSHQGVLGFYGGALVQWEPGRQPFCTLGYIEATIMPTREKPYV